MTSLATFLTQFLIFDEPKRRFFDEILASANFFEVFRPEIFPDLGAVRLEDVGVRLEGRLDQLDGNFTRN